MGLPIATVNVVLRTATVGRAGFGTPLFISSHRRFQERVRTYTSIEAVGEDFDSTDAAYVAAQQFFSHTPSVSKLKIGRREADSIFTPSNVDNGSVHTITVTVNDGDSVTASYTSDISETAADVSTALIDLINGDADVAAHITASASGDGITITTVAAGDVYSVSGLGNIEATYTSTETAADVLDAITEVDGDFYFVTADDHTETFVLAMATAVQAMERLYFVSNQEMSALTTFSDISTDIPAKLKQNNYTRTAVIWDEEADSKFVECSYVGVNAPFSPDEQAVVWDGRVLPGISVAKNSSGNMINSTQQLNLDNRNASHVVKTAAGDRVLGGKTAEGTWIDELRIRDCIAARVKERLEALLLNQAGTKVPGGSAGKVLVQSSIIAALTPFIASDAIVEYTINLADAIFDNKTRTLSNVQFDAILSGAILRVVVNGTLTNQEQ